jgi:hypothetical protein
MPASPQAQHVAVDQDAPCQPSPATPPQQLTPAAPACRCVPEWYSKLDSKSASDFQAQFADTSSGLWDGCPYAKVVKSYKDTCYDYSNPVMCNADSVSAAAGGASCYWVLRQELCGGCVPVVGDVGVARRAENGILLPSLPLVALPAVLAMWPYAAMWHGPSCRRRPRPAPQPALSYTMKATTHADMHDSCMHPPGSAGALPPLITPAAQPTAQPKTAQQRAPAVTFQAPQPSTSLTQRPPTLQVCYWSLSSGNCVPKDWAMATVVWGGDYKAARTSLALANECRELKDQGTCLSKTVKIAPTVKYAPPPRKAVTNLAAIITESTQGAQDAGAKTDTPKALADGGTTVSKAAGLNAGATKVQNASSYGSLQMLTYNQMLSAGGTGANATTMAMLGNGSLSSKLGNGAAGVAGQGLLAVLLAVLAAALAAIC